MAERGLLTLLRVRQADATQADSRQLPALLAELVQLQERLRSIWNQLAPLTPEYIGLRRGDALSWQALKGRLDPGVVLAEYFCTDDVTLLFIARHDLKEPQVYPIALPLKDMQQWVRRHFGLAANVEALDEAEYQSTFGELVAPIGEWAKPNDVLYLAPHDVLHYIPLHALQVEGRYLIDRHRILYTPSATVSQYCLQRRKVERGGGALVLGYAPQARPLPHAYQQARAIARRYHTEPLLDGMATKAAVATRLQHEAERERLDVLHIACHGRFEGSLGASLELADGPLTAQDFFRHSLPMKAALVTLSACESGVNERRPGDELIGLTRALMYAGTPSVLVSLWSVDDLSTGLLMDEFYEQWDDGRGTSKVIALQKAQQLVRDMTIEAAIAVCQGLISKAEIPGDRMLLSEDIARLRFKAGDFAGARTAYERLLTSASPDAVQIRRWRGMVNRCEWAAKTGEMPHYERKAFDRIYDWAPFILVGDWQ